MSLLRLLFGLLVAATIILTALTLVLFPWAAAGRGGVGSPLEMFAGPAAMTILCALCYRWLRRREC